jgi:hypothetical protein
MNSDGQHNKFKTYSEPEEDEGEFDPDREAVRQFVSEFCIVDPVGENGQKLVQKDLLDALSTWVKINDAELDNLSEDVYIDNRKGNLKNIIENEFELEREQFRVNGNRKRGYRGIVLSDNGKELLEIEAE